MEKADGVKMASNPPWLETKRDNFSEHIFVGGNKLMLDILKNNKEQLGINRAVSFDKVLNKTEEILQSAASITLLNQTHTKNTLNVELKLTSETGHKLPTSFPSRRAFIHFTVYDGNDNILFESGKVNADGSIVGANSDTDRRQYEPHYDTITSENQVQIYEAIMQNTDSELTYTLLRAASYKKDNRILPKGFDKNSVPSDIAVLGDALGDDDFIGGSDTITYSIDTTAFATTPSRVEIELLYQTLSYPFAQDLFSDKTSQSESFRGMFESSNVKTSTIATHAFSM
ncbi:MAG: hypothetical protein U9N52_13730, partial [Campylobacterota bacterium]|nr:hypothetical protein [Campylobacterota bacterium]